MRRNCSRIKKYELDTKSDLYAYCTYLETILQNSKDVHKRPVMDTFTNGFTPYTKELILSCDCLIEKYKKTKDKTLYDHINKIKQTISNPNSSFFNDYDTYKIYNYAFKIVQNHKYMY